MEAAICQSIERDMAALTVYGRRLQEAETALDEAERADPAVLARRDEAKRRTRRGPVQVRGVATAVAGEAAARDLGFVGSTPRDPVAVEEPTGRVLARMATAKVASQVPGVTLDVGPAAAALTVDHAALVQANADALESERRTQLARSRRDALWAEHTRERSAAAGRLEAELRAVGLDDVADCLAPETRKAGAVASKDGDADGAKPVDPVVTTPAIHTRPSLPPVSPS